MAKKNVIDFGSIGIMVGSYDNSKQKKECLKNILEYFAKKIKEGRLDVLHFVDAGDLYEECYIKALREIARLKGKNITFKKSYTTWDNADRQEIEENISSLVRGEIKSFNKLYSEYPELFAEGKRNVEALLQDDKNFKKCFDEEVKKFTYKHFAKFREDYPVLELKRDGDYNKIIDILKKAARNYLKKEIAFREVILKGLKANYEFYPGEANSAMKHFTWHCYNNKVKWRIVESGKPENNNEKKILYYNPIIGKGNAKSDGVKFFSPPQQQYFEWENITIAVINKLTQFKAQKAQVIYTTQKFDPDLINQLKQELTTVLEQYESMAKMEKEENKVCAVNS